jgi:hypothetical protein
MGKKSRSGSGMNNPDPRAWKPIFLVKILKFFDVIPGGWKNLDMGSRMEKLRIRDRIRNTDMTCLGYRIA